MVISLSGLLQNSNQVIQVFGLPGTYKTTFMLQIIRKILLNGNQQIYLIDTSGNFPIVRLKSMKELLHNIIVFHPKSLEEVALLLDDLSFQLNSTPETSLFIDDIFSHTFTQDRETHHLNSYILAQIRKIATLLTFPILVTNQARKFEDEIRPYLQRLTLEYLEWHVHFERPKKDSIIKVTIYNRTEFIISREYNIDSSGFLILDEEGS